MTTDDTPNDNTPIRNGKGQFIRTLDKATRDAECARLYSQGGWTFKALAAHLGYHDHSCAIRGYQRAVREAVQDAGKEALALHLDRMEYLWAKAVEIAEADHVVVSHGKVITDDEGTPLRDHAPVLAAVNAARQCLESVQSLTGMKQPAKVQLSGGVTYQVVGVDAEDLT
ncbi:hypothetical protein [Streptomyces sp. 1222.5]|uniref:hypothetical protein n=1 Tax=Streptomyces sp. 1222.5 TaxID=1881026 RepID=UPI003EB82039